MLIEHHAYTMIYTYITWWVATYYMDKQITRYTTNIHKIKVIKQSQSKYAQIYCCMPPRWWFRGYGDTYRDTWRAFIMICHDISWKLVTCHQLIQRRMQVPECVKVPSLGTSRAYCRESRNCDIYEGCCNPCDRKSFWAFQSNHHVSRKCPSLQTAPLLTSCQRKLISCWFEDYFKYWSGTVWRAIIKKHCIQKPGSDGNLYTHPAEEIVVMIIFCSLVYRNMHTMATPLFLWAAPRILYLILPGNPVQCLSIFLQIPRTGHGIGVNLPIYHRAKTQRYPDLSLLIFPIINPFHAKNGIYRWADSTRFCDPSLGNDSNISSLCQKFDIFC